MFIGCFQWRFCRALCVFGIALIADAAMAANDAITVAEQRVEPEGPIAFDLPAQPLVRALESYSAASGLQVVYDGTLATGRQSAEVKGVFTPEMALRMLLGGTGLAPRYMAADGFMLVPSPVETSTPQDPRINTAPSLVVARYYGRIQAGLERAFCADSRTRAGGYRIALGFWIGSSGAVTRSALLGSTGDSNLDATIDRTVRDLAIGEPPPAGFAQPVILVVTPELTRDCQAVQEGMQPIRAEP